MEPRTITVHSGEQTAELEIYPDLGMPTFLQQLDSLHFLPSSSCWFVVDGQRVLLESEEDIDTHLKENTAVWLVSRGAGRASTALIDLYLPNSFAEQFLNIYRRFRFQRSRSPPQSYIRLDRELIQTASDFLMTCKPASLASARDWVPRDIARQMEGHTVKEFLVILLEWFHSSTTFVKTTPCVRCGSVTVSQSNTVQPTEEEKRVGVRNVELHRCQTCHADTRFPRHRDPTAIIANGRRGRCGELSILFTTVCRALGLEARLVTDLNDHIWTEVFDDALGHFVHTDPCENTVDTPLMYEKGWGKTQQLVVAVGMNHCTDVTPRYTEHYERAVSDPRWPRRYVCHVFTSRVGAYVQSRVTINDADQERLATFVRRDLTALRHGALERDDSGEYRPRQSGA